MELPEDHISERTERLLELQPAILEESQPVKEEARKAMALMKDVIEVLSRTEIDLAFLIVTPRRNK